MVQPLIHEIEQPLVHKRDLWQRIVGNYQLYLILLIPTAYIIIFKYIPMYGAQIAFRNYSVRKGIWGSAWVGLYHFKRFFDSYQFRRVILNTLGISIYHLAAGFPIPIILALSLNSTNIYALKKTVQTTTYIPHFISVVVMVGMVLQFLSPRIGIVNELRSLAGLKPLNFIAEPEYFKSIYVWSGIWQNAGWASIIYLAALSSVDPTLHEAAVIDGASKFQRVRLIDFPGILPTAIILLIINAGRMMNVGFEKVFLLQNDLNLRTSEVIQTYVYKVGLASATANYSYSTAIGLFNSFLNLFLIITVNRLAKRLGETSLW
jgi:putative aldouronate transport system permease protein